MEVGPGMRMQKGAMFTAYHLWKVAPSGGPEIQLSGKGADAEKTEEIWPTWSPDGKWIAVQRRVDSSDDIWVYELATGRFYPITTFGNAGKPTWSADGKSIWFVRFKGKDQDVWLAKNVTMGNIKASARKNVRAKPAGR
jgi:Tol biopolymer transport system component